jgi:hypothetical protein
LPKKDDERSTDEMLENIKNQGLVSDRTQQVLQGLSNLFKIAALFEEIEEAARVSAESENKPMPSTDELRRQLLKAADFSDLRGTLFWHAAENFKPERPVDLISLWQNVILWINEGNDATEEFELPEGFVLGGKSEATAWEIVLANSLGAWIEEETFLRTQKAMGVLDQLADEVALYEKYLPFPGAKLFPDATVKGRAVSAKEKKKFFASLDSDSPAKDAFLRTIRIATEQPTNESLLRDNPEIVGDTEKLIFLDNWRRSKGDWTDEELYSALKNGV